MGQEEGPAPGHVHGSFAGSGPGLPPPSRPNGIKAEDLEWDPTWVCERIVMGPENLPEKNLARQHGGWGSESSSGSDKGKSSPGLAEIDASPAARHFGTSVPPPVIDFDFRAAIRFGAKTIKAAVGGAPEPLELMRVAGGSWSGSFGSGTVVAGGYYLDKTETGPQATRKVHGAFRLQMGDGDTASIEMRTHGVLSGPADLLDAFPKLVSGAGGTGLDPRRCGYSYRMVVHMTTTHEKLAGAVNSALWIGSGIWKGGELVIE
ncbi:UPF0311 protein [Colletotrichum plurivorum]|uniref:UPF0311 protein n=1 Tax=Colletotrichum plurivorum TaxID=2175906 RepID=A0A8H6K922_9PEZI|nr:UPF0311 protein [Colletotrichum plurivorum]